MTNLHKEKDKGVKLCLFVVIALWFVCPIKKHYDLFKLDGLHQFYV